MELCRFAQLGKKIVGAGLNYRSVISERGLAIPKEPVVFLKPSSSYITEGHIIEIPSGFEVHHEIELGVIIGKPCRSIEAQNIESYIAGYCLALDLTAVDQLKTARSSGLPWSIGKGFDTSCPVSNAISKDLLPNANNVRLWCSVNGNIKQDENTSDMIFNSCQLISYISKFMTLEPYDLVLTGTPKGTGPICSGAKIKGGLGDLLNISFEVK